MWVGIELVVELEGLVVDVVVVGGTVVVVAGGGGPVETTRSTVLPGRTEVPAGGSEPMTVPAGYWVDDCWMVVPTFKKAVPSVLLA